MVRRLRGLQALPGPVLIEIPADLHPACVPLAWLLGTWRGVGVGGYPTVDSFRFGQEIVFDAPPAKAFLTYSSTTWALEDDGALGEPLAAETGYWRMVGPGREPGGEQPEEQPGEQQGEHDVEVVLAHPTGIAEIFLGSVQPARVELASRGVLKTESAKDYRAARRMYGLVEGRLMWVMEMAAMGHELQAHVSAELRRD